MKWFDKKFWRFAISKDPSSVISDCDGIWVHLFFKVWFLLHSDK